MQIIRQALKNDAVAVAPLIVQAMGDLACSFVGSKNAVDAIPLFETLFQHSENQYSHDNTLVFEENGVVLGSITAYNGDDLYEYRNKLLHFIKQEYNISDLYLEDETKGGELYIDTLSVSPLAQGKGVGTRLLKARIQKAKSENHTQVGLLVDIENTHAKRLYLRLGFKVVGNVRLGNDAFEHMQLLL